MIWLCDFGAIEIDMIWFLKQMCIVCYLKLYDRTMLVMTNVDRCANCCLWEMMTILPMRNDEYPLDDMKWIHYMINCKEEHEKDMNMLYCAFAYDLKGY